MISDDLKCVHREARRFLAEPTVDEPFFPAISTSNHALRDRPEERAEPKLGALRQRRSRRSGHDEPVPERRDDVSDRVARGRAARKAVPRAALGAWEPGSDRQDPTALLRTQELTRVPDLVALRHARMLSSPFAFYRGAAVVMAADLAASPRTDLHVQCCGDAHLANFGGFASPERDLVFDVNDFDETSRGPFEWDVKRLAASFEIAARSLEHPTKASHALVAEVGRSYRGAIATFASMPHVAVWYARIDLDTAIREMRAHAPDRVKQLERVVAKGEHRDNLRALRKLTSVRDGEIRFRSDPPLLVPLADLVGQRDRDVIHAWLVERFQLYVRSLPHDRRALIERYRVVDVARKVVGVGSIGTRCWVALLVGRDETDPLFLQIKEAEASVLEPHAGRSAYANHGQRVVEGQRLMQANSDILLGWFRAAGFDGLVHDYYVRQLWDWKVSVDVAAMNIETLHIYARLCAWTLARAHAVSGDAIAIAAYLGASDRFDEAITEFASAYADQNQRDFDAVTAHVRAGRF
jgi:uncharacterized protein (DUF2252 family)